MDLIYNPPLTPLLQEARDRGIPSSNGLAMLMHQALEAFYIWTGKRPPLAPIQKTLKDWEREKGLTQL